MHPSLAVPPGLALTAPWGVFEWLLLPTFAAHLLAMNVALGGTLVVLFTPGAGRGAAVDLGGRLPTVVAVTVNLGIPALLFASVLYGRFLYTAAVLSAVTWLSLFLVVMVAYALLYQAQPRLVVPASRWLLALAALLLVAASLILVNVSTLSVRPQSWMAYFDQPGGTILNFADRTFFPRWLHFLTASLAVGGLFLALISRKAAGQGDTAASDRVRLGLCWFTRATMVQFAVGVWFLFTLPQNVRLSFLGGNAPASGALLAGLGLAAASLVAGVKAKVVGAASLAVATVGAMVVVRELLRQASLAPGFSPAALPVAAQWGPFVMFVASSLAVAVATVWLVVVYRRRAGRGE